MTAESVDQPHGANLPTAVLFRPTFGVSLAGVKSGPLADHEFNTTARLVAAPAAVPRRTRLGKVSHAEKSRHGAGRRGWGARRGIPVVDGGAKQRTQRGATRPHPRRG